MNGTISTTKGTLLHSIFEFNDDKFLGIQPLVDDVAIILLDTNEAVNIKLNSKPKKGVIATINHNGDVVGEYEVNSPIVSITNTILYPKGQIWSGQIDLEGKENEILFIVLTQNALGLLHDSEGFSFNFPDPELIPTILIKFRDGSIRPQCGAKSCQCQGNSCNLLGKFIKNGLYERKAC